jgi:adenosylcobinamide amidohydrolase
VTTYADGQLATFAQAEERFQPHDPSACSQRLDRLRFEADDYLTRLTAAKTVLVLRMEANERQKIERADAH